MVSNAQRELTDVLIHRAFEPVLRARPDRRSEAESRRLTRKEIDRYKHYGSAAEVVTNFKRDLTSDAAKKVHSELRSLDLPTLDDVRDEFGRKADELGVGASS